MEDRAASALQPDLPVTPMVAEEEQPAAPPPSPDASAMNELGARVGDEARIEEAESVRIRELAEREKDAETSGDDTETPRNMSRKGFRSYVKALFSHSRRNSDAAAERVKLFGRASENSNDERSRSQAHARAALQAQVLANEEVESGTRSQHSASLTADKPSGAIDDVAHMASTIAQNRVIRSSKSDFQVTDASADERKHQDVGSHDGAVRATGAGAANSVMLRSLSNLDEKQDPIGDVRAAADAPEPAYENVQSNTLHVEGSPANDNQNAGDEDSAGVNMNATEDACDVLNEKASVVADFSAKPNADPELDDAPENSLKSDAPTSPGSARRDPQSGHKGLSDSTKKPVRRSTRKPVRSHRYGFSDAQSEANVGTPLQSLARRGVADSLQSGRKDRARAELNTTEDTKKEFRFARQNGPAGERDAGINSQTEERRAEGNVKSRAAGTPTNTTIEDIVVMRVNGIEREVPVRNLSAEDIGHLSYRQLMTVARLLGVSAKGKQVELVSRLRHLLNERRQFRGEETQFVFTAADSKDGDRTLERESPGAVKREYDDTKPTSVTPQVWPSSADDGARAFNVHPSVFKAFAECRAESKVGRESASKDHVASENANGLSGAGSTPELQNNSEALVLRLQDTLMRVARGEQQITAHDFEEISRVLFKGLDAAGRARAASFVEKLRGKDDFSRVRRKSPSRSVGSNSQSSIIPQADPQAEGLTLIAKEGQQNGDSREQTQKPVDENDQLKLEENNPPTPTFASDEAGRSTAGEFLAGVQHTSGAGTMSQNALIETLKHTAQHYDGERRSHQHGQRLVTPVTLAHEAGGDDALAQPATSIIAVAGSHQASLDRSSRRIEHRNELDKSDENVVSEVQKEHQRRTDDYMPLGATVNERRGNSLDGRKSPTKKQKVSSGVDAEADEVFLGGIFKPAADDNVRSDLRLPRGVSQDHARPLRSHVRPGNQNVRPNFGADGAHFGQVTLNTGARSRLTENDSVEPQVGFATDFQRAGSKRKMMTIATNSQGEEVRTRNDSTQRNFEPTAMPATPSDVIRTLMGRTALRAPHRASPIGQATSQTTLQTHPLPGSAFGACAPSSFTARRDAIGAGGSESVFRAVWNRRRQKVQRTARPLGTARFILASPRKLSSDIPAQHSDAEALDSSQRILQTLERLKTPVVCADGPGARNLLESASLSEANAPSAKRLRKDSSTNIASCGLSSIVIVPAAPLQIRSRAETTAKHASPESEYAARNERAPSTVSPENNALTHESRLQKLRRAAMARMSQNQDAAKFRATVEPVQRASKSAITEPRSWKSNKTDGRHSVLESRAVVGSSSPSRTVAFEPTGSQPLYEISGNKELHKFGRTAESVGQAEDKAIEFDAAKASAGSKPFRVYPSVERSTAENANSEQLIAAKLPGENLDGAKPRALGSLFQPFGASSSAKPPTAASSVFNAANFPAVEKPKRSAATVDVFQPSAGIPPISSFKSLPDGTSPNSQGLVGDGDGGANSEEPTKRKRVNSESSNIPIQNRDNATSAAAFNFQNERSDELPKLESSAAPSFAAAFVPESAAHGAHLKIGQGVTEPARTLSAVVNSTQTGSSLFQVSPKNALSPSEDNRGERGDEPEPQTKTKRKAEFTPEVRSDPDVNLDADNGVRSALRSNFQSPSLPASVFKARDAELSRTEKSGGVVHILSPRSAGVQVNVNGASQSTPSLDGSLPESRHASRFQFMNADDAESRKLDNGSQANESGSVHDPASTPVTSLFGAPKEKSEFSMENKKLAVALAASKSSSAFPAATSVANFSKSSIDHTAEVAPEAESAASKLPAAFNFASSSSAAPPTEPSTAPMLSAAPASATAGFGAAAADAPAFSTEPFGKSGSQFGPTSSSSLLPSGSFSKPFSSTNAAVSDKLASDAQPENNATGLPTGAASKPIDFVAAAASSGPILSSSPAPSTQVDAVAGSAKSASIFGGSSGNVTMSAPSFGASGETDLTPASGATGAKFVFGAAGSVPTAGISAPAFAFSAPSSSTFTQPLSTPAFGSTSKTTEAAPSTPATGANTPFIFGGSNSSMTFGGAEPAMSSAAPAQSTGVGPFGASSASAVQFGTSSTTGQLQGNAGGTSSASKAGGVFGSAAPAFVFGAGGGDSGVTSMFGSVPVSTPSLGNSNAASIAAPAFGGVDAAPATTPMFGSAASSPAPFGNTSSGVAAFGSGVFGGGAASTSAFGNVPAFGSTATPAGASGASVFYAAAGTGAFGASSGGAFGGITGPTGFGSTANPTANVPAFTVPASSPAPFGAPAASDGMFGFGAGAGGAFNGAPAAAFGASPFGSSAGFAGPGMGASGTAPGGPTSGQAPFVFGGASAGGGQASGAFNIGASSAPAAHGGARRILRGRRRAGR